MRVCVSYDDGTAAIIQVCCTDNASIPQLYANEILIEDQLEVSDPAYWVDLYGEDDFAEGIIADCEVNEARTDIELK